MPAMMLTRPTMTDFITWVNSLDPAFAADCVLLGRAAVTVRVVCPGTNGTVMVRQNQTLTADQDPTTLVWTVTVA